MIDTLKIDEMSTQYEKKWEKKCLKSLSRKHKEKPQNSNNV